MKTYDVFASQGGYGVALGIYLGFPVMGTIRWFETKEEAETYAKNKKAYDAAYTNWEQEMICTSGEGDGKAPIEDDYKLNVGITI